MSLIKKVFRAALGGNAPATWTAAQIRRLLLEGKLDEAQQALQRLEPATPNRDEIAHCLRGELAFKRRNDDEAERHFRAALRTAPGLADAHYGLSLLMRERGDGEAAVRHAIFAVNNGNDARYMAQVGLCQLERSNFLKARDWLSRAVMNEPNDKYAWNNLGIARRSSGNLIGAQAAFQQALRIDPSFERARENAATLAHEVATHTDCTPEEQSSGEGSSASPPMPEPIIRAREHLRKGDAAAALSTCERALDAEPGSAAYVLEIVGIHEALDDVQSGIDALRAYRVRWPEDARVRTKLGCLLARMGGLTEARSLLDESLAADPNDVEALVGRADLHFERNQFVDAGALLERALKLRQETQVEGSLIAALTAQCRYDEVIDRIEKVEQREPEVAPNLWPFRFDALTGLGRHDEILPLIDDRLRSRPHDPGLHWHRATIQLLRENYAEGWKEYAYRNVQDAQYARMFPFPSWRGQSLKGKSLLIGADQGLGDQVMFASCLRDVMEQEPARVVVEVSKRIATTIRRSFPDIEIVGSNQDMSFDWLVGMGEFDYACLIADLPQEFRPNREAFPQHHGYLFSDVGRKQRWLERLDGIDGGRKPRIGFSWKGGTERTRTTLRTIGIRDFDGLQNQIDATWVCLQYGDVQSIVNEASAAGRPLAYWPEGVADLDQFAALIDALDLVITVCNTTVHFAGALGKPVWVMAPKVPEWRYGLTFRSMPWYPSSVIYRQPVAGDWAKVFESVGLDLCAWRSSRSI